MKKYINVINSLLVLSFFVYIITIILPRLNQLNFLIRHISLYLALALLTYRLIDGIHKILVKKSDYNKILGLLIRAFKLIVFAVVLTFIAFLQVDYIERKETLYARGCFYYDEYNHLIYKSIYRGPCPEINNYQKTDHSLSFTVTEIRRGDYNNFFNQNFPLNSENESEEGGLGHVNLSGDLELKTKTDVNIQYDDRHRIKNVIVKSTELIEKIDANETEDSSYYSSIYREVTNEYHKNFVEIITDYGEFHERSVAPLKHNHHFFNEDELERTRVYTDVEILPDKEIVHVYKESTVDGEFITELIADSIVTTGHDTDLKYKILTDIKAINKGGVEVANELLIKSNSIEYNLIHTEGGRETSRKELSWNQIKNFNYVMHKKRAVSTYIQKETKELYNHHERYYDHIRGSVIIHGSYMLKKTPYGKKITDYIKPDRGLFENRDYKLNFILTFPYFEVRPNYRTCFDYETQFLQQHNSIPHGDLIYQETPLFASYYND